MGELEWELAHYEACGPRGPLIRTRVRKTRRGGHWERKTDWWETKREVFWGEGLSYSLVSDAEIDSERRAGPERLLNVNPCFTICRLCDLSKWHYLWTSAFCLTQWDENPRCCRIEMRLKETMHVESVRESKPSTHRGLFCESPCCTCVPSQLGTESSRHSQWCSMFVTTSDKQEWVTGWWVRHVLSNLQLQCSRVHAHRLWVRSLGPNPLSTSYGLSKLLYFFTSQVPPQ